MKITVKITDPGAASPSRGHELWRRRTQGKRYWPLREFAAHVGLTPLEVANLEFDRVTTDDAGWAALFAALESP